MFIVLHAPYNRYYRARGTIEEKMIRRKPERGREREREEEDENLTEERETYIYRWYLRAKKHALYLG